MVVATIREQRVVGSNLGPKIGVWIVAERGGGVSWFVKRETMGLGQVNAIRKGKFVHKKKGLK